MMQDPSRPTGAGAANSATCASRGSALGRTVLWGLLFLSVLYFGWRGPWRAMNNSGDLAVGYTAARAWIAGTNPYDPAVLSNELSRAGAPELVRQGVLYILPNIYFPSTLAVWLPMAGASWPGAKLLWLVLNICCTFFIIGGLIHLLGWRPTGGRALAMAIFVLALAPVQSTIGLGQTAVVATATLVAAMLCERHGQPMFAGVFYALTTLVKVQIGLPFLAYLAWRRRWRALGTSALLLATVSLVIVVRMEAAGIPWYQSWTGNVAAANNGGITDPSPANTWRHSLINLQYPLHSLSDNRPLVNAITFGLVGLAALATVLLIPGRYPGRELLALSLVAVLGLLVAYHRTYDAVVLALPIAWALANLGSSRRWPGAVVLVLCADFLVPTQTMLHVWQQAGHVPQWLTDTLLWRLGLMSQQVWALVLMSVVLLWDAALGRIDNSFHRNN